MEWLGNETYAYIPFEAPPEVQEQLAQLEKDLDGESLRTQLVISLDGASKMAEGDEAEICVNSDHMHLFDPVDRREPHPRHERGGTGPLGRHDGPGPGGRGGAGPGAAPAEESQA